MLKLRPFEQIFKAGVSQLGHNENFDGHPKFSPNFIYVIGMKSYYMIVKVFTWFKLGNYI